jgi:hypothetical protein
MPSTNTLNRVSDRTEVLDPIRKNRARRDPVIITRAREYLRKNGPEYRDPGTQFFRWLFEPENRRAVLADRAPNPLLQRVLLFASRKHPTERWVLSRTFPRFYGFRFHAIDHRGFAQTRWGHFGYRR